MRSRSSSKTGKGGDGGIEKAGGAQWWRRRCIDVGVGFGGMVTTRVWAGLDGCVCVLKREDVAGLERAGGERELLLSGVCAESRSAEWDIVLRMCWTFV